MDPYTEVSCPYQKAHQVQGYKMANHLIKCQERFNKLVRQVCPFDYSHHIEEAQFQHHVANCPKRVLFDRVRYDVSGVEAAKLPVRDYNPEAEPVSTTESWDDDEYTGYEPAKAIENRSDLIRRIQPMQRPSERRKFREEMRRQYQEPDTKNGQAGSSRNDRNN